MLGVSLGPSEVSSSVWQSVVVATLWRRVSCLAGVIGLLVGCDCSVYLHDAVNFELRDFRAVSDLHDA